MSRRRRQAADVVPFPVRLQAFACGQCGGALALLCDLARPSGAVAVFAVAGDEAATVSAYCSPACAADAGVRPWRKASVRRRSARRPTPIAARREATPVADLFGAG